MNNGEPMPKSTSVPFRLFAILFSVSALLSTSCGTAQFYTQAAAGQWQLLADKQPVEKVIHDTPADAPLRRHLQLAQEIVAFAESDLDLKADGAYSSYIDLHRPYVVWNVQAAEELSMDAKTWWYPLVGSLEYRGYFREELAIEQSKKLKAKGYDVHVGGVPAYSTLGYFKDPLMNTFIDRPTADLAELLFHELAHRRLFFSGDTDFNEAFATAVGREGVRRWLPASGRNQELRNYTQRRQRNDEVIELILQKRQSLESMYEQAKQQSFPPDKIRERKSEIINSLRRDYNERKKRWPGYRGFEQFMDSPINNARLNGIDTYYELVPKFERLLNGPEINGDLTAFYRQVESMKNMSKDERRQYLDGLVPGR